ncbi:MAG: hypothetical protein HY791_24565 [Deltaproteobacteria bacterium]|nr:hypothetical protein [Deltaproteobacteria bacterium]
MMSSRFIAAFVGSIVILAACGEARRPGSTNGTPKPKDAGVDFDSGFAFPDGTTLPDVGNLCTCDTTQGICNSGCLCDFDCITTPDSGVEMPDSGVDCGGNPNGCVTHQRMDPSSCACLQVCDPGYLWTGTTCIAQTPDAGVAPDGGFPTTDPFVASTIVSQLGQALCDRQARCDLWIAASGANPATCQADYITRQAATFNAMKQAIDGNRIGFRQSQFSACLSQLASADCDTGTLPGGPCDQWTYGTGLEGAGCTFTDECATGLYCAPSGSGFCGTCQPRLPAGQRCEQAACLENLQCFRVGDGQGGAQELCLPVAQENGTCGDVNTGLCSGNLQCVGAAAPYTCRRPVTTAGQACDPMLANPSCSIERNLVCGTNNTCTQINWNPAGGSCASNSPVDYCRDGLACTGVQNQETCVAPPAVGASCPDGFCAEGAYCDASSVCQSLKGAGQACTGLECQPGLICDPSSRVCGTLNWTRCGP